jgi:hypothetical protein
MNITEALKLAGDYADSLTTADDITNRDTMQVAAALDATYEARDWVAEWLEQKPAPKSGRALSRFQADSRNRFAQWLAWRLEQDGRHPLHGSHTYRLLDGATIAKTLNFGSGEIQSEATIRPLKWFLRYYKERIPAVWTIAVDLAGGNPSAVTRAHVKQAVAQYKGEVITPKGVQQLVKAGKATRLRIRIKSEFAEMVALSKTDHQAKAELDRLAADLEAILDAAGGQA